MIYRAFKLEQKILKGGISEKSGDFPSVCSPADAHGADSIPARRRGRELTRVNFNHAGCKKRRIVAPAVLGWTWDDQVKAALSSPRPLSNLPACLPGLCAT